MVEVEILVNLVTLALVLVVFAFVSVADCVHWTFIIHIGDINSPLMDTFTNAVHLATNLVVN